MKKMLISIISIFSMTSTVLASTCESWAGTAATEKFRDPEYGCYGHVSLTERVGPNTMHVTVDPIGGYRSCTQKIYVVKFKESNRTCTIVSINRLGIGWIR